VLEAVADSRLVLKNRALEHESVRNHLLRCFAEAGIDAERLTLLGKTPTTAEHLACYHEIDIALDTFPYHGTTTTCEALWMGVPVVTQIGRVHASRVGLSLLTCLGLEDLAANDEDGFVRIAVELAGDGPRLAELHETLRDRLRTSPLCDGPSYTRRLEQAYTTMWQDWCRGKASGIREEPQ
jgi:predicted O-linked N-acetylglucosamine transferase (SPINDLY family)